MASTESPSTPVLDVKGLNVHYATLNADVHAVKDVSFALHAGESVAIVGESGSGKSSIALALMGLLDDKTRVTGSMDLEGRELADLSEAQWQDIRGNDMAMIFQDPMTSLNPYLTVGYQIMEPLFRHRGLPKGDAHKRVSELLHAVGINDAEDRMVRHPHEFSGGMRQRAMIAMAMSCDPKVLIADEPTTALDVITQRQVLQLMREMRERYAMGLLLITHDLGIVAGLCDRVIVMKDGEVVEAGTVDDIYHNAQHPYTEQLLAAVPRVDRPKQTRLMKVVEDQPFDPEATSFYVEDPKPQSSGQGLIAVRDLSVTFYPPKQAPVKAVDNVTLDVFEGEVLGLVGQSGSGKSTLIRAMLQLIRPDSGRVLYRGTNVCEFNQSRVRDLWREWQLIFQDPFASLDARMTVEHIIREPLLNFGLCSRREARHRVAALMKAVQLDPDWMQRFPHEFSGGQRQRIGIARALAVQPKVLFCDEPVSALDVSIQAEVLDLLQDLREEMNLTMVFISHDLAVVRHIADRVAVMTQGEIVECTSAENIYTNAQHYYTKSLLEAIPIPDPRAQG